MILVSTTRTITRTRKAITWQKCYKSPISTSSELTGFQKESESAIPISISSQLNDVKNFAI